MAREEKVWEYAIEAGYTPLEDRCIIVKGVAGDLSNLRLSGVYASRFLGGHANWHAENVDSTLEALSELGTNTR